MKNSIKELEKEIEEEQEKRPIRCFAEAMKYGGDSEGERVRILKGKLQILKDVLKVFDWLHKEINNLPTDRGKEFLKGQVLGYLIPEAKQKIMGVNHDLNEKENKDV